MSRQLADLDHSRRCRRVVRRARRPARASGTADAWTLLADAKRDVPCRDSAWFSGRLWCGSDDRLCVQDAGALTTADSPAEVLRVSGRIDVSADATRMLTAASRGAAMFDGVRWEALFRSFDLM